MTKMNTENDAALQAVHESQAEKKKVEQTIAKARQLIATAREKIAAATVPGREDLDRQRVDINARLALGEADASDLARIDAEIEKHEEATEAAEKKIAPLMEQIAALESRIAQEEEALRKLLPVHDSRKRSFLMSEAEAAGKVYVELARELENKYLRIGALNELLGENVLDFYPASLAVPAFRPLKAFETLPRCGPDARFIVHGDQFREESRSSARLRQAEIDRLRKMGVEFP